MACVHVTFNMISHGRSRVNADVTALVITWTLAQAVRQSTPRTRDMECAYDPRAAVRLLSDALSRVGSGSDMGRRATIGEVNVCVLLPLPLIKCTN